MRESQYLQKQSDEARAAIGRTLGELEHDVGRAVNPRAWVRAHPWISLSVVAVAAGFVASRLLSHHEQPESHEPENHPHPENGHAPSRWSRAIPILTKAASLAWTIASHLLEAQKAKTQPQEPVRDSR